MYTSKFKWKNKSKSFFLIQITCTWKYGTYMLQSTTNKNCKSVHISCLKAGRPVYENNTSKHIVDKNREKYSYIPLPWSLHSSKTKTFTEGHYLWTVQRNKRISYINTLNIDMLLECVIFFFFPRFTNIYLDMKQPLYM